MTSKLAWQLNSLIFPLSTYQKSAPGTSSLAPVGCITPPGQWNGPVKVPIAGAELFGMFLLLCYYLQQPRGYSPLVCGFSRRAEGEVSPATRT